MANSQDPVGHAVNSLTAPDSTATLLLSHNPTTSTSVLEKAASSPLDNSDRISPIVVERKRPTFTEVALDWAIKILGLAAAVLFGIWVPISYKATADGNSSSDAAQTSLMDAQASLNDVATSAMSIAASASFDASTAQDSMIAIAMYSVTIAASPSSQTSMALDALTSLMVAIGQLNLYAYCDQNTGLAECSSLSKQARLTRLAIYLAALPTSSEFLSSSALTTPASPTSANPETQTTSLALFSTPSVTPSRSAVARSPKSTLHLAVPAILGIVSGVLAFLGIALAIYQGWHQTRRQSGIRLYWAGQRVIWESV